MTTVASSPIPDDRIRERADGLIAGPVARGDLALAFARSSASSVDVHVEGRNFYPPMLEDIASASSSVHINQFGFKPGVVGEAFADALVARAAEGISVRLVVDSRGSDPEGSSKPLYDRLTAAGVEICVTRATKPRVLHGPLGAAARRDGTWPRSATSTTGRS